MKRKCRFSIILVSIPLIFLGLHTKLFAQSELNITLGYGLPELLNVGLRYQYDQFQFGGTIGTLPIGPISLLTLSGSGYFHFAGNSQYSKRKPWYLKAGFDYLREESSEYINKYNFLSFRLGRDFNLSKEFGIELEAGALFQTYFKKIEKVPGDGWKFNLNLPVLPSFGIIFFYRI